MEWQGAVAVVGGLCGSLDPAEIGPGGGSRAEKDEKIERRKTEDRVSHRRKRDGHRLAR
jgi:hypothetical protein